MTKLKSARHFTPGPDEEKVASVQPAHHFDAEHFVAQPTTGSITQLKEPNRWWWKLAKWTLAAVIAVAIWQWIELVNDAWQHSVLKGSVYTIVSVAVLVLLGTLLMREWRLWRRLKQNARWQSCASRIRQSVQFGEAQALCLSISQSLPQTESVQQAIVNWQRAVNDQHSDEEQLQLFEQFVLSTLDKQAQQLIYHAATDTSLAVAVSPFALADMLLVIWRSSRLVRELAQLYGGAIGQLRSMVLLKQLLGALLWAGGSELALDMASDVLSSELTAKISLRAGQGVIAGLLVARLGNLAQQTLRPLPSSAKTKVSIKQLSASLLSRFNTASAN